MLVSSIYRKKRFGMILSPEDLSSILVEFFIASYFHLRLICVPGGFGDAAGVGAKRII